MIRSAGFAIAAVLACSTWEGGAAFGEQWKPTK
jgi:hypothetical protein